jgi:flagellar biosynthesis/type III secretory pathway protein FliH
MTQQTRIQRYDATFLQDFFANDPSKNLTKKAAETEKEPEEIIAPTFSEAELDAAKKLAHQAGFQQGYDEGLGVGKGEKAERDQAIADCLQVIASKLEHYKEQYQTSLDQTSQQTNKLALSIAKKLVGAQLAQHSEESVQTLLREYLPDLMQKPAIIISLHPDLNDALSETIKTTLDHSGFSGDISINPDASLGAHDITLSWDDGKIEQHLSRAWAEIETLVQAFTGEAPTNTPSPNTSTQEQ